MQNKERAKLFMPFDALKGFRDCLRLAEKNINSKKTISEEMENDINNKLLSIWRYLTPNLPPLTPPFTPPPRLKMF